MKPKTKKTTAKDASAFEAACKKEGIDPKKLPDLSMIPEEFRKPLMAAYKLMVGYKAKNNGWIPELGNPNQKKFYPYAWDLSSGFGIRCSCACCDYDITIVGSRLLAKTPEKALEIFNEFKEECEDWYLWK